MPSPSHLVAAMLLNGGASRRMGRDKSQLLVEGSTLAVRTASLLLSVVETAIEVGSGVSGLPATSDDPPGQGPLAGVVAGCAALRASGHDGGALVVACDLPFLSVELLRFLVEWDSNGSVVPVVRGMPQPLCARWGQRDLDSAGEFFARGQRSVRHLSSQPGVVLLDESEWKFVAAEEQFCDVDSPDDLRRFGMTT
jgi:molybdopterin-guanine dinucleotide biosynthesis protein A